ncbi:MAG: RnfABCDGE type electron transport complex subunit G [Bacteroidales bacterium]|nr:RnfABCDGE type electron transport complex subunit G [Bacteroidales bacterium]
MAKKAESSLKNMLLALTFIALAAGLALALVNNVTKGPIENVNKEKVAKAVAKVLPQHDKYTIDTVIVTTEKGDVKMARYTAVDANGNIVGKAIESFDPNGFGGKLSAMVGFDAEGNISGYEILASSETPGLGAKADKWFQKEGKGNVITMNPGANGLKVKKDGGDVDAITGSTITSRAFCRLVNTAFEAYNK